VKPINMQPTGIMRTPTRRAVILFTVMFVGFLAGCFQTPASMPDELFGKYITTHPGYEDQYFELGPDLIIMGFADGTLKFYDVKSVEIDPIDRKTLYSVLCANEDYAEEFNFAFFADLADEGIIHFRNKPQVSWEKEESEEPYNDDSEA
jgi:hypothetical protein